MDCRCTTVRPQRQKPNRKRGRRRDAVHRVSTANQIQKSKSNYIFATDDANLNRRNLWHFFLLGHGIGFD
jgi:hypothetical protein